MKYKPGETVPQSGIYAEYTILNVKVGEVTCVKGEPFPPTTDNGYHYLLVHAAEHRRSGG